MKDFVKQQPDGYTDSIRRGMKAMRLYSGRFSHGGGTRAERIRRLKTELDTAEAIVIGAGAGLSTSAGLTYSGERFTYWFRDFAEKFGIENFPQSAGIDICAPNFPSLIQMLDDNVEMCYWCSEKARQIPWETTNKPKLEDWLADPEEIKNFL